MAAPKWGGVGGMGEEEEAELLDIIKGRDAGWQSTSPDNY